MGSGRPDLGSDRPDWGSERPILRPRRLFSRLGGGTDGRTDGRTDGNRKICPMWNHRSSAPPGPLPKKTRRKKEKDLCSIAVKSSQLSV